MSVDLQKENEQLKLQIASLQNELKYMKGLVDLVEPFGDHTQDSKPITIIVLGASGDLAKKKTYPALFDLFRKNLLPTNLSILGYARTAKDEKEFRKSIVTGFKGDQAVIDRFASICYYQAGQYTSVADFEVAAKRMLELEESFPERKGANRIFYFAIPPSVFLESAQSIRTAALTSTGWNRLIIEKPFGKDLASSNHLSRELAQLFREDQMYRIDHYLGKELVQNIIGFRFYNTVWEPVWNQHHIANVQITFKEPFGTEGRGGYFDEFGIVRDIMQNHLLQVLALVAIGEPASLGAEDIRNAKVKTLKAIPPIKMEDLVIGQYVADPEGKHPGYLDDSTVPKGSLCPTFAAAVLHINNSRWRGVPFIMKAGKALNERKVDVRIQFKPPTNGLEPNVKPNELVIRIQPNESIYLKFGCKKPGLTNEIDYVDLDLTYSKRFKYEAYDAYERLILDCFKGDHNLFVRADELEEAWRIFTPILHELEEKKIAPIPYVYGSRGPVQADELAKRYGFERNEHYAWKSSL
eukprot:TRINITY_DN1456_c0_g1_i1.p1 TRINITY_DN1456_c0_g1~~TRINITY_DN1456_c0_g1_i1.p1  ORF type:complete len:543 (-),score=134.35 TRINITY_DN1456_c0_g1_i1:190-1761(-)